MWPTAPGGADRWGGIAALLYVVLTIGIPMVLVAALVSVGSQILFLAYFPLVTGLVYLSDQYVLAATAERRAALAGGAEALVAMNNAYGPSDTMTALGVLLFSPVMFRGLFPRWVAYPGIAVFVAAVAGAARKPVLGAACPW